MATRVKPAAEVVHQEKIGPVAAAAEKTPGAGRVLSIDALRGFDMFWIIGGREIALATAALVATPLPAWLSYNLNHPDWIGFSAWDMIMPLFLFIVGAAMPFSFAKRIEAGQTAGQIYTKVLLRTALLFVLGMVAQGRLLELDLDRLRIFSNTLQAIAAGYLIASILMLHLPIAVQVLATAALLAGYWGVLRYVPVPGQAAGTLEPQMNIALYVDQYVQGRFQDGTTYTWILSGLGFGATVMLGVFAGDVLRTRWAGWLKVLTLVALGGACLAGGWLWSRELPIIKHIWTSSMVLWAGGWSFLLLAGFYLVIDVIGLRRWAFPFVVIGANAIFVYILTRLINFHDVSDPFVGGLVKLVGPYGELISAAAAFGVIWLVLWYMYRKGTFVRI